MFQVGRFTLVDGGLTGPAAYFASRGGSQAAVDLALASATFEFGLTESPSPEVALLVALQTDYAAFVGEERMAAALGRAS
jgi:hypothetical protein